MQWVVRKLFILVCTSAIFENVSSQSTANVDYFDRLRQDATLLQSVQSVNSSNVFRVIDVQGNEFRLTDIASFLPFSAPDGRKRQNVENDALAVLLAIDHFNNVDKSPILSREDIGQCNVKLTAEIFDTEFSPVNTARIFTDILQRNRTSLQSPRPTAVVGAYRSAVTSPLALLSGTNDILQVSYASTSADFESKTQFPYFGRTVSNSVGEAKVALQFFKQYVNASHIGVLFVTDSFGSAAQKAFQDAASEEDIVTDSVGFPFSASSTVIRNAVRTLAGTKFRIIYAICFEQHYRAIMEIALEEGMIGGDFLWVFMGFDINSFQREAAFLPGSPLIEATRGVGVIQMTGGLVPEVLLPDTDNVWPLEESPSTGFEKLRSAWRSSVDEPSFTNYVRSKLPIDTAVFDLEPNPNSPFLYDAVTALGLSFCSSGDDLFTGPQAYEQFRVQDFDGTSGQVRITPATGTRDYQSMIYVVWNAQSYDRQNAGGNVQFQMAPTNIFQDGEWFDFPNMPFIYGNGGVKPPESLPPVNLNPNKIGDTGQAAGYTVMSLAIFLSLVSMLWLWWYRERHVVRSSQPIFLFMVSFGSLVMASTTVPLSLEEPVSLNGLNAACVASPWLYISGTSIMFSALVTKTRGVHLAYIDPKLEFIQVTPLDILRRFLALFSLNLITLLVWTFTAPLEWSREFRSSTDIFDRNVESFAGCKNGDSLPFAIVLAVINGSFVLLGSWWAFQSRNIETEFNENRYIGMSLAMVLQAWGMGVPILIVVWDNPQAKFFVQVGIIFVTACAALLLVYLPKALSMNKQLGRQSKASHDSAQSTTTVGQRAGVSLAGDQMEVIPAAAMAPILSPVSVSDTVEDRKSLAATEQVDQHEDGTGARYPVESSHDDIHLSNDNRKGLGQSGLKVFYNPRSARSLVAAGGREVSRGQLDRINAAEKLKTGSEEPSTGPVSMSDSFATGRTNPRGSTRSDTRLETSPKKMFQLPAIWRRSSLSLEDIGDIQKPVRAQSDQRLKSEGIRVLHNPRSIKNLQMTDGLELTRAQLKYIEDSIDAEAFEDEREAKLKEADHEADHEADDSQVGNEPSKHCPA